MIWQRQIRRVRDAGTAGRRFGREVGVRASDRITRGQQVASAIVREGREVVGGLAVPIATTLERRGFEVFDRFYDRVLSELDRFEALWERWERRDDGCTSAFGGGRSGGGGAGGSYGLSPGSFLSRPRFRISPDCWRDDDDDDDDDDDGDIRVRCRTRIIFSFLGGTGTQNWFDVTNGIVRDEYRYIYSNNGNWVPHTQIELTQRRFSGSNPGCQKGQLQEETFFYESSNHSTIPGNVRTQLSLIIDENSELRYGTSTEPNASFSGYWLRKKGEDDDFRFTPLILYSRIGNPQPTRGPMGTAFPCWDRGWFHRYQDWNQEFAWDISFEEIPWACGPPEEDDEEDDDRERRRPPPEDDEDDDDMNCCRRVRDNWEMLRQIYRRTGARDDFPIRVPENLRDRSNQTTSLQTSNEVVLWLAQNLAETLGEWPYKVKVSDDSGEEDSEEVEFPNISEALAEISLLGLQQQHSAFVINEIALKLAVELLNLKVITLTTQGHVKSHSSILGVKGETEERKVPCQFNFGGSRLSEILEGTEHEFDYFTAGGESGGENVLGLLEQIRALATVSAESSSTRLEDLEEAMLNIEKLRAGDGSAEDRWQFLARLLDEGLLTRRGEKPKYEEINLDFGAGE